MKDKNTNSNDKANLNKDIESLIADEVQVFKDNHQQEYDRDKFFKLKELSSGSFGTAYLLKSNNSQQKFVRKVPNYSMYNENSLIKEAEITDEVATQGALKRVLRRANKRYPLNIRLSAPQVFSIGKKFDMEFIQNGDLTKKNKDIDIYDILKQLAKLVNDLHSSGYIHRDIKPANLLLGSDDKLRLADLDSVIERKKYNIKTLYYTKPYADIEEYISQRGNKNKIDIYSSAVTTIEYSLGTNKFYNTIEPILYRFESRDILSKELKKKYISLAEKFPDDELGLLVTKMLLGKYESMEEVLSDLDKNKTISDKKALKIALSNISNEERNTKISNLISVRFNLQRKINRAFSIRFIKKSILKAKLENVNKEISTTLKAYSEQVEPKKREELSNLAEAFENNTFTNNFFVITKKSIERQREKNQAVQDKNISIENFIKRQGLKMPRLERKGEVLSNISCLDEYFNNCSWIAKDQNNNPQFANLKPKWAEKESKYIRNGGFIIGFKDSNGNSFTIDYDTESRKGIIKGLYINETRNNNGLIERNAYILPPTIEAISSKSRPFKTDFVYELTDFMPARGSKTPDVLARAVMMKWTMEYDKVHHLKMKSINKITLTGKSSPQKNNGADKNHNFDL